MSSVKSFASSRRYASWDDDYQKYLKSGLTQEEWCRENDMSLNTFRYRLSRLRRFYKEEEEMLTDISEAIESVDPLDGTEDIILEADGKKIYLSSSIEPDKLKLIIDVFMKLQTKRKLQKIKILSNFQYLFCWKILIPNGII